MYYALGIVIIVTTAWFTGRKAHNDAANGVREELNKTLTQVVTAQAERIALLEKQNEEQAKLLAKYSARIDYLEERLGIGYSKVVQA